MIYARPQVEETAARHRIWSHSRATGRGQHAPRRSSRQSIGERESGVVTRPWWGPPSSAGPTRSDLPSRTLAPPASVCTTFGNAGSFSGRKPFFHDFWATRFDAGDVEELDAVQHVHEAARARGLLPGVEAVRVLVDLLAHEAAGREPQIWKPPQERPTSGSAACPSSGSRANANFSAKAPVSPASRSQRVLIESPISPSVSERPSGECGLRRPICAGGVPERGPSPRGAHARRPIRAAARSTRGLRERRTARHRSAHSRRAGVARRGDPCSPGRAPPGVPAATAPCA